MKIQDILFIILLILPFIVKRANARVFIILGIVMIMLSAPFFYMRIFFTAQRLVMYGAGFILVGIVLMFIKQRR